MMDSLAIKRLFYYYVYRQRYIFIVNLCDYISKINGKVPKKVSC